MKLEPPLVYLVMQCEKLCEHRCCGISAFDFNPIHLASALLGHRGAVDPQEVVSLRGQIEALKVNYGTAARSGAGVSIDEMNQMLSAREVDELCDLLLTNLEAALELVTRTEGHRTTIGP